MKLTLSEEQIEAIVREELAQLGMGPPVPMPTPNIAPGGDIDIPIPSKTEIERNIARMAGNEAATGRNAVAPAPLRTETQILEKDLPPAVVDPDNRYMVTIRPSAIKKSHGGGAAAAGKAKQDAIKAALKAKAEPGYGPKVFKKDPGSFVDASLATMRMKDIIDTEGRPSIDVDFSKPAGEQATEVGIPYKIRKPGTHAKNPLDPTFGAWGGALDQMMGKEGPARGKLAFLEKKNLDETSAVDDMLDMAASTSVVGKPIDSKPAKEQLKLPINIKFERDPKGKISGVLGSVDFAQLTKEQVETIVREELQKILNKQ